jgi:hypothetical protein
MRDYWLSSCFAAFALLLGLSDVPTPINCYSPPRQPVQRGPLASIPSKVSRRSFLVTLPLVTGLSTPDANALDFDSFIQGELDATPCDEKTSKKCKPQMTKDQAMCRFGQPSPETGNACLRAGLPTTRPGGVDAFGKIDRGDYVRCKGIYVDDPERKGMLMKQWVCQ